jgi:hypothetical protein
MTAPAGREDRGIGGEDGLNGVVEHGASYGY